MRWRRGRHGKAAAASTAPAASHGSASSTSTAAFTVLNIQDGAGSCPAHRGQPRAWERITLRLKAALGRFGEPGPPAWELPCPLMLCAACMPMPLAKVAAHSPLLKCFARQVHTQAHTVGTAEGCIVANQSLLLVQTRHCGSFGCANCLPCSMLAGSPCSCAL
jgi:hypothetical protein